MTEEVNVQAVANRNDINTNAILAMRNNGATLQQIADKIDRTKERVRQILTSYYGSTKHKLISTEQLRKSLGLSRNRVIELYENNVIAPARVWNTSNGRHLLWSPTAVEKVTAYYHKNRLCRMCNKPIPMGRRVYCSDDCYKEGHKYKYMTVSAKKRQLRNIKRYRERVRVMTTK